jgi:hypothetical protein
MSTKFFVTPVTQQLFSTLGCQTVASGANKPFQVVESSRHFEVCSEWLQKAMYSRSGNPFGSAGLSFLTMVTGGHK